MLEQERFNRARIAAANYPEAEKGSFDLYLQEELATQNALESLGVKGNLPPSKVKKVGSMFLVPELIENLRIPYVAEILGMPGAGKTTMITRYLEEQWNNKRRFLFGYVEEGVRNLKEKYGELRHSNPFEYSFMGSSRSFLGQLKSTDAINQEMRVIVTDRGAQDRRVFKRALFLQGKVPPFFMTEEAMEMDKRVDTPMQMGGIIMFMIRPEISIERSGKEGPVVNPVFLPYLYEQYWRLHHELVEAEVPYRIYTCIDAEADQEEIYERFKYAMDSIFNLHMTMYQVLYQLFPNEMDEVRKRLKQNPELGQSYAEKFFSRKLGGLKVKIVGGDDLVDVNDILKKPFVEARFTK